MVKTLLGKIFRWSIFSQIFVGVALAVFFTIYPPYPRRAVDTAFSLYAQSAVLLYEKFGPQALGDYLSATNRKTFLDFELHAAGKDSTCSTAAPGRRLGISNSPEVSGESAAIAVDGTRGAYCLVVHADPGKLPESLETRRWRLKMVIAPTSLVIALITCAILSYAMARYLSRPITELRRAAQRLAKGDLSARIGEKFIGRDDEVADLVRDFDHMASRIGDLLESQQRLIGDISHEIKSPLARLSVALGLAERTAQQYAPKQFERMDREVEKISTLARELLTLSSLDNAAARTDFYPFDLCALIEEVIADVAYEAEDRAQDISFERPAEPVMFLGDESLFRRAVENIVRNAIFYTTPGVKVAVVLARVDDRHIRISVLDDGPGVPEAALPHLFEPFYRVDHARGRGTGGAGIGLAICQRAVAVHGGSIRAQNRNPHGLGVEVDIFRKQGEGLCPLDPHWGQ